MKRLLILVITGIMILTSSIASACIIDQGVRAEPRATTELETICESVVLHKESRDACIVHITELVIKKRLVVSRFDTYTIGVKLQSTKNWDAWSIKPVEMLDIVSAIFIINSKIKRIILGIETVPLFEFTYDEGQLCTTAIPKG